MNKTRSNLMLAKIIIQSLNRILTMQVLSFMVLPYWFPKTESSRFQKDATCKNFMWNFAYHRIRDYPRFEKEAKTNSELAY